MRGRERGDRERKRGRREAQRKRMEEGRERERERPGRTASHIFALFIVLCDSFRSCFRMKVGRVFGKVAGKESTVLLLIYVLSGVCISTSQSLSVSGKRDAIFESMQYMYNCETLFSLR